MLISCNKDLLQRCRLEKSLIYFSIEIWSPVILEETESHPSPLIVLVWDQGSYPARIPPGLVAQFCNPAILGGKDLGCMVWNVSGCSVVAVLGPTLTPLVLAGIFEPVSQISSFKNLAPLYVVFTCRDRQL